MILPPLDLVAPSGDRVAIRSLGRDDTVGRLAVELGSAALWTTRRLDASERLVDVDDLRIGVRLSNGPPEPTERAVVDVEVIAGPASTSRQPLEAGRHVIGRSPLAAVRLDDRMSEPHHALLDVGDDGTVAVTQLTGSVPIRADRDRWEGGRLEHDAALTIGSSVIRVRPHVDDESRRADRAADRAADSDDTRRPTNGAPEGALVRHPADPWRRVVWRAPHRAPQWHAPVVTAPVEPAKPSRPSLTGLIGTGVTAGGAVVIATVMSNAIFMLFAAMGVVASLATFLVGVGAACRATRRHRREYGEAMAEFTEQVERLHARRCEFHRRRHPDLAEALDEARCGGGRVWQRRVASGDPRSTRSDSADDGNPLRAAIGTGTARWAPLITIPDRSALDSVRLREIESCARLVGVTAPITLAPADAVAVHGPTHEATAIVRSVIAQFAMWVGPADWQLVVVSCRPDAWAWSDWLPHGALDRGSLVVVASGGRLEVDLGDALDAVDESRRTVVVTDVPQLFAARTGPLRRFVTASRATSLVVVDSASTVPAICRRILSVGATGTCRWSGDVPPDDDATDIVYAGISTDVADDVARYLACLVDPEDDGGVGGGVPATVTFADLFPDTTPDAIRRRWANGGADPAPSAPIGTSLDGRIDIDLVRDGPHGLIAGTTGAGKSELLRTLVLSLATSHSPEHLNFVLVDYKGGATFDACTRLPHTVGLVTDLDEGLAERALVSLEAELHRRERVLRSVGASDLTEFRTRTPDDEGRLERIPRLVVVIDEFAALAKELPEFLAALVGIAQRGRSLGVHLLLATQRPAGVVNDDIRANTNLRLALRLHDKPDAVDVVDDDLPASFPRGLPGRAALRLGPDELVVFQAARCTGPATASSGRTGIVVERSAQRRVASASRAEDSDPGSAGAGGLSELAVTVDAIVEAAESLGVAAPHRPWVEPLPFPLLAECFEASRGDGDDDCIGWIDVPDEQSRAMLSWSPVDGSLALIGSIGSGTTSTLIALAAASCSTCSPTNRHLYVLDARGDDGLGALASLAHCGGVVRLTEGERVHRLLARVVAIIDRRLGSSAVVAANDPEIVLMIDGYGSLRSSLSSVDRQQTFDLLQRVVNDGPAGGVALVVADDGGTAVTMLPVTHRWIFHLDDPGSATSMGLRAVPVAADRPGRLRVLASGREAQVVHGAPGLAALPGRDDRVPGAAEEIGVLEESIAADSIDVSQLARPSSGAQLLVGVAADDLRATAIEVADGDHLLVVGGPRSGVSTAVARLATAWEADARRRGGSYRVMHVARRCPVDPHCVDDASARIAIVIDDAHRVDDPGLLAAIATGDHPHITVIAGARADVVRTAYGHWTREIAKSRCGLVMSSRGDPDGDLLGVQVPRRPLVATRPGLGWVVDGGPLRQVQVATD